MSATQSIVTRARSLGASRGLLGIAFVVIGLVVLLPVAILLTLSLKDGLKLGEGAWTTENYSRMFESGRAWEGLKNTLAFTVGGAAVALVFGTVMAWGITSVDLPFKRVLRVLPMFVLVLPPLLKNMSFIMVFGPDTGLLNMVWKHVFGASGPFDIYTMYGMIVVVGLLQAPVAYSVMLLPFQGIDKAQIEASRMSGVRLGRTVVKVVLPTVLPAMLSAFTLIVISIASSFETPVLIGLPGGIHTYMSEIYRSMSTQVGGLNIAAAQATLYFVLTLVLVLLYMVATRNERKFEAVGGRGHEHVQIKAPVLRWLLAAVIVGYALFAFVMPLVITILASFLRFYTVVDGNPFHDFTTSNFHAVFTDSKVVDAIQTSGQVAVIGTVGTLAVSLLLAVFALKSRSRYRRGGEFLAMAPKTMPGVVYSVGLLLTVLAVPGLAQYGYGKMILLYIAIIVTTLPFAYRLLSSSLIQVSDELMEASRMSGASPMRTVRSVIIPIVGPALLYAAGLVFSMAYRELGAIIFLIPPNTSVVSQLSFQYWVAGGLPMTAALNLVAVVVPFVVIGLLFSVTKIRLPRRGPRRPAPAPTPVTVDPVTATLPEVPEHVR